MKIKGIYVKVNEAPQIIEFEESLAKLQEYVGGFVEFFQLNDEDVDVVVNEEGKLIGLPLNKLLVHKGKLIDCIVGDFLVVGINNDTGETISVPEEKMGYYLNLFKERLVEI